jgi:hypothetical protein
MSNIKKATRIQNEAGDLVINAGNTIWKDISATTYTVTTTNNTPTIIAQIPMADGQVIKYDVVILGRNTATSNGACFNLTLAYLRNGGAPVAIGTMSNNDPRTTSSAATWSATFASPSGNDIVIAVTGATSADINWTAIVQQIRLT